MFFTRIVIDQSGSMCGKEEEVVNAVNRFIDQLSREPSDISASLAFFEDDVTVTRPFQSLATFAPLTAGEYKPCGGTALYDALGESIMDIDRAVGREGKAILAIVTDGGECSSKVYDLPQVKALVAQKRRAGWSIFFLSLDLDGAEGIISDLGLDPDLAIGGSKEALAAAMKSLSSKVRGLLHA